MTASPHTTRPVSHAEARAVARRLIAGSFRRDGERPGYDDGPRFSIPTRPDHDDDCLVMAYIEQREAADLIAYGDAPDVRRDIAAAQAVPIAEQFAEMERRHRQRHELPPLPPVGGYGVRHEEHYSAQQMRDYASAAVQHDASLIAAHEAEEARLKRQTSALEKVEAERDEWRVSSVMLCDEKIELRRALDAAHDTIRCYERRVQAMREQALAVIAAGRPA